MARSKNVNRSITYIVNKGGIAQSVEKYIPQARKRIDLFNFIDVIAAVPDDGIIGIQICAHGELNAHWEKILHDEKIKNKAKLWLESFGIIELHGWRKLKNKLKSGKFGKGYHWEVEIIEITLHDL